MKRILIILTVVFCTSCFLRRDDVVDLKNIDDKIYVGMTKEDLIKKIGIPNDSVISDILEKGNYIYEYETNDFTGYTLKVWFNNNNEITRYRID